MSLPINRKVAELGRILPWAPPSLTLSCVRVQPKGAKRGSSSVLLKMAPGAKRAKGSDNSPIKGASPAARKLSPAVRKVKGKPAQDVIWDRKEGNAMLQPVDDNTAWEALLSVCSDITA